MDADKLRTALNGTVVTSDAYSRSGIQTGTRTGNKWARLLRLNK